MRETFTRQERLKKKKLIGQLFDQGKSLTDFPLRLVYLQVDHGSAPLIQAGVSVSKKNFRKAVDRNKIKRRIREAYRKNKHLVLESNNTKKHIFMFIYLGKEAAAYQHIEKSMRSLLQRFLQKTSNTREI